MSSDRGNLILVIGTSSSGKTSSCKLLQKYLSDHYLLLGLDTLFGMVNPEWGGGVGGHLRERGFRYVRAGDDLRIEHGDEGQRMLVGMVSAVDAILRAGNNVIYDEMLLSEAHWKLWQPHLKMRHAVVVQLHAEVLILDQRERQRARHDKYLGLARGHIGLNDVTPATVSIDTSQIPPEEVADRVMAVLDHAPVERPSDNSPILRR